MATLDGMQCLRFTTSKMGAEIDVTVPILPPLREAVEPHIFADTFLHQKNCRPFTKESYGNNFADWVKEAGLSGISSHGVRKGLGNILADLGCTQYEIMSIHGHTSPKTSEIYTRGADRMRLAVSGMERLKRLDM